ncbi:uncharacterized protein NEMAJ01_0493 [Nematocida major]|uniref:uncharacterized protein n=1 Tax=Nematocida major TaxID=1912982 RepID=UPI0020089103|nr:uncharacterized protein NEMAJ01_0493 [Nematocida major]KAH9385597.1 hypothetical protein NEMAJ01_0493 [Nematocida major]
MEGNAENPFNINPRQKRKYEAKKRSEEIRELEIKYKDEEMSESTEDDASYDEREEENMAVQELIEKIRAKDPKIYEKSARVFEEIESAHKSQSESTQKPSAEAPYRLKEYYRETVLQEVSKLSEEMDSEKTAHESAVSASAGEKRIESSDSAPAGAQDKESGLPNKGRAIDSFLHALNEMDTGDQLFHKKQAEEENDAGAEDFLTEYVLKGGWQKECEKPNEENFLQEDSEEIELIEEFDQEIAPTAGGAYSTVKKPAQRRKRKELKKQLRNREEEKQRQEEIKRLKNLKKQQFADRLSILRSVSGVSKRKLSKIRLEECYDKKEFDKTLDSIFGESYFDEKETKRPKIKGFEMEAEELKQMERLANDGEMQADRNALSEIRKIISEIREIGEEYETLKKRGDFEYVEMPTVNIGLSVRDILLADDKFLKKNYSIKKFAPYQEEYEKKKMERYLKRTHK